jgi:hypothetical protein
VRPAQIKQTNMKKSIKQKREKISVKKSTSRNAFIGFSTISKLNCEGIKLRDGLVVFEKETKVPVGTYVAPAKHENWHHCYLKVNLGGMKVILKVDPRTVLIKSQQILNRKKR